MKQIDAVLECLNSAFQADPDGFHALLGSRVPTTQAMADHPHVIAYPSVFNAPALGPLGVINGLLTSIGLPRVAASFDNGKMTFAIAPDEAQPDEVTHNQTLDSDALVALIELVDAKNLKDSQGKTPEYEAKRLRAWALAEKVISQTSVWTAGDRPERLGYYWVTLQKDDPARVRLLFFYPEEGGWLVSVNDEKIVKDYGPITNYRRAQIPRAP